MSSTSPEAAARVNDCRSIQLPKIPDERGNLTFIESSGHLPFGIRRAYWIYDVPGGEWRGGHAYHTLHEFFVALSGSFDLMVDDGSDTRLFSLNRSYYGILVPPMIWRHVRNFSTNAVCLVLASGIYDESDYIRDYELFVRRRRQT